MAECEQTKKKTGTWSLLISDCQKQIARKIRCYTEVVLVIEMPACSSSAQTICLQIGCYIKSTTCLQYSSSESSHVTICC